MQSFIRVKGLRKSFKGHVVIDDMNLSVAQGEILILNGPSGIGKSTFLRCLNHLDKFQKGEIQIGDLVLDPRTDEHKDAVTIQLIRKRLSFLFQFFNLFPHLTVLGNITLGPIKVLNKSPKEAKDEAMAILRRVGLGHKASAYPTALSGGQCQRVALARALAMSPQALLLDEPTSSLDPDTKREIVDVIEDFTREKLTMIIVTHEAAVIERIATRLIRLGPRCSILSDEKRRAAG